MYHRKHIISIIYIALTFGITACSAQHKNISLCNKNATKETVALYQNLNRLKDKGVLFGHQDALAYGVNWRYEEGRSDIKDVVNDYPAVYGWDLGGMEYQNTNDIDGVPFEKTKKWIQEIYDRGGISTFSWHMDNPFTGKNAWDTTPNSFASILPKGSKHELYKKWLDHAAEFLSDLKGSDGKSIPILYRPFHELTGNWFWWCKNNAKAEDFKLVWKFTVEYLTQEKKLNNLIFVYNTADFKSKEEFLEYYPGDEYVDILSFDKYVYNDPTKDNSFVENCQKQFAIMYEVAKEHHKIMAFAETGYEQIPYDHFWTDTLTKAIGNYPVSFVLVWRNHGWQEQEKKMHYYAPHKGHPSENDFKEYYQRNNTFFQKDIAHSSIYNLPQTKP